MKRANKAGIARRIQTVLGSADQVAGAAHIDFALAFWMVHEVPDRFEFLKKISTALKPNGALLVAEPSMHVSRKDFDHTLVEAARAGLQPLTPRAKVRLSLSKVLVKQQG
jgi:2-polyprenyl-3-methyl-5-hydroxy-6-metoxy-1,4-benzoquinol methylase